MTSAREFRIGTASWTLHRYGSGPQEPSASEVLITSGSTTYSVLRDGTAPRALKAADIAALLEHLERR